MALAVLSLLAEAAEAESLVCLVDDTGIGTFTPVPRSLPTSWRGGVWSTDASYGRNLMAPIRCSRLG